MCDRLVLDGYHSIEVHRVTEGSQLQTIARLMDHFREKMMEARPHVPLDVWPIVGELDGDGKRP